MPTIRLCVEWNSADWMLMGRCIMSNDKITVEPSKIAKPPVPVPAEAEGCANSFLTEQKDEIGNVCKPSKPQSEEAKEKYVQPDAEKESGGEG